MQLPGKGWLHVTSVRCIHVRLGLRSTLGGKKRASHTSVFSLREKAETRAACTKIKILGQPSGWAF